MQEGDSVGVCCVECNCLLRFVRNGVAQCVSSNCPQYGRAVQIPHAVQIDPKTDVHPFTVIGVWEETGETLAEHVFAADPHKAMAIVAGCRDNPVSLTILGAIDGKVDLIPACEDSGKAACALDLCGEEV